MPHLRIAIGYRTPHRQSEPVVLAAGFDPAPLQRAVDAAAPEFQRFEIGVFHSTRKAVRRAAHSPSLPATEMPPAPAPGPIPPASTEAGGDGQGEEGPTLVPDTQPAWEADGKRKSRKG